MSAGRKVPSGRLQRLARFGGMAGGVLGSAAAHGLRELASGNRPQLSDLLLTPANARRVVNQLADMRGAAMKLGQLLSMDAGEFIPPELADILARLRADAQPMPDAQLRAILIAAWGPQWQSRLAAFDATPIAAASIGQVHRARALDGRDLAIKIQYPGIIDSIDSDVDNVSLLLRSTGLLPKHIDISPLLDEAKRQLRDEADYQREAQFLTRYAQLLDDDPAFALPHLLPELTTPTILAMTFVPSDPLEAMRSATQAQRDTIARRLMALVLRELFDFGIMQSDPNLANFRFDRTSDRIVLLDFGAAREISPAIVAFYRDVLGAGLAGDQARLRHALENVGLLDSQSDAAHVASVIQLFDAIVEPLLKAGPFDFGDPQFLRSMRQQGMTLLGDRRNWRLPPAESFFVQRKIGGTYQIAAMLGSRVDVGALLAAHLGTQGA